MSNPILTFLEGRKQKPLKEGKKPAAEIDSDYSISVWVANAAQRAAQLSLVSHPAKFSHPDAKTTPVLFSGEFKADGYLYSGNVPINQQDVVGNAAALDVYGFLSLSLYDGNSVLDHFEAQSHELKQLLNVDEETFQQWRNGFLQIKNNADCIRTHATIKQVYFPFAEDYHLLSVLYPSGLMTENYKRIRTMKFADEAKAAREARSKKQHHEQGFSDLPNLLVQHFGGTKPQNISKLNSNNGGEAWLLPCFPPELDLLRPHLPKKNFFYELRLDEEAKTLLKAFRSLLLAGLHIEAIPRALFLENRNSLLEQLFAWLLAKAQLIQMQNAGWSRQEGFKLPNAQQIWLDAAFSNEREQTSGWQNDIAEAMTKWLLARHKYFDQKSTEKSRLSLTYSVEGDVFQAIALKLLQQELE